jgi:hypothetical protein
MLVADVEVFGDLGAVITGACKRADFVRRGLEVFDKFSCWLPLAHDVTNIAQNWLMVLNFYRCPACVIRYVINRIIKYRGYRQGVSGIAGGSLHK